MRLRFHTLKEHPETAFPAGSKDASSTRAPGDAAALKQSIKPPYVCQTCRDQGKPETSFSYGDELRLMFHTMKEHPQMKFRGASSSRAPSDAVASESQPGQNALYICETCRNQGKPESLTSYGDEVRYKFHMMKEHPKLAVPAGSRDASTPSRVAAVGMQGAKPHYICETCRDQGKAETSFMYGDEVRYRFHKMKDHPQVAGHSAPGASTSSLQPAKARTSTLFLLFLVFLVLSPFIIVALQSRLQ